jgi:putative glutamine amidotransferase
MKKILVTQRLILNESYHEVREALDIEWGKLFSQLDFLPIVLPVEVDFKKYFELENVSGVMLTGGNDLSIFNNNELSIKRDNYEKNLISYCIEHNIPLLGICRGMQLIGNYFNADFEKVSGHVAIRHSLVIDQNSRYYESLKEVKEVNSYHNYALKYPGDNIMISAKSPDGIIKAIEHKSRKVFGQMWHPEREHPFSKSEMKLIKSFFNNQAGG